jgi:SAM-dependent methyltransferase
MRTLLVVTAAILAAGPVAVPSLALETNSPYRQLAQAQPRKPAQQPDVIFVPTPHEVVDDMLRLANVRKGDILYDLGSGDGRIAIAAAKKYGVRAVGIDIDPERIREATENARKAGVTNLVEFRQEDLFKADFREATVVTLYLLPDLNVKLRPRLWEELKPGTRIVSHQFDMGTWKPEKRLDSSGRVVYFWTIPARKKPQP